MEKATIKMESKENFDDLMKVMSKLSEVIAGSEFSRKEIIQELISTKGDSFPAKLFHYTSANALSGIIESNTLWATESKCLNDATELVHGARLLVDELEKYGNVNGGDISILLNKLAKHYREHGEVYRNHFETYIISFSEDPDMLSQWRAYAEHAKGLCIEFDLTDSRLFTITTMDIPCRLEILPVIYNEDSQRKLIRSGIERVLSYFDSTEWTVNKLVHLPETELIAVLGFLLHSFEPFITTFKHIGFSEEKEWRAVASYVSAVTGHKKKEKNVYSGTRSYIECIFLQANSETLKQRELLPITGIKYGPLAENNSIELINSHLVLHGYKNQVIHSKSEIPLKP